MNPRLARLQPCPFEKLRQRFAGITPNSNLREIKLSIREPQHATPDFIKAALSAGLGALARYPNTLGTPALRQAIAGCLQRRCQFAGIDPDAQSRLRIAGRREFASRSRDLHFELEEAK